MFLYADATACPRCRATLPARATHCDVCRAVLDDAVARDVFAALQQVDHLVARLAVRRVAVPVPAGAAASAATMHPAAPPPPLAVRPQPHPVMSGLTVPKVLLGLGALCLVVAALVFLVVAWASLGVGGRTVVLVAFTLTATGLAAWSARAGLRAGAESLASVGFGLLVLDLAGARTSGWLGGLDTHGFALLVGAALMLTGAAATILTRHTREPRLVSTEVAASLGVLAFAGGLGAPDHLTFTAWLLTVLTVTAALALVSWRLRLGLTTWTAAGVAALAWSGLAAVGLLRLAETPSWADLVVDARAWPLVVAAAVAAVPASAASLPIAARVTGLSVALALVTALAAGPAIDERAEVVALTAAAVAAIHALLAVVLRRPWASVTATPLLLAGVGLGLFVAVAALQAVAGLLDHGLWDGTSTTLVVAPSLGTSWAGLLPLCTIAACGAAVGLARVAALPPAPVLLCSAAAVSGSLALAPVLYGVPVLAAVAALVLGATLTGGWALARRDIAAGTVTLALVVLALGGALVDDGLTIGVLALVTAALAGSQLGRLPLPVRTTATWGLPCAAAATAWAIASAVEVPGEWRAVPVIAVTGLLALVRPAAGHEAGGLMAALVSVAVGSGFAPVAHELQAAQLAAIAALTALVGLWRRPLADLVALGLFAVAALVAWPDPLTATVVLGLGTAAAVAQELRRRESEAIVARAAVPVALGALLWSAGDLAGLPTVWLGVPVVLALAALAIWRPDPVREAPAGLVAAWAAVTAVASLPDPQAWTAVYLTIGGVALSLSALVHASRRRLAWGGLTLLTAATWLRLEQIGVDTVEAYTLPLASVLLVVGTIALLRSDRSSLQTQGAGLGLALVPSLLQALAEPLGLRGVLLGIACVVLIGIGVTQRWAAPLLAGGGTLAVLVLRQVLVAQELPQWALIGLAGVTLTYVGLTWEKRLADVRTAASYVRGLR